MAKAKTIYFCQECGYESAKWMGQCPSCKAWNTFVEEYVETSTKKGAKAKKALAFPTNIVEVSTKEEERISTHMKELDRVLNGGIVRGSLSLVGGDNRYTYNRKVNVAFTGMPQSGKCRQKSFICFRGGIPASDQDESFQDWGISRRTDAFV